jgi:restriction system protein
MSRLIPGGKAKHEQAVEEARNRYDAEKAAHDRRERERRRRLAEARAAYESELAKITARVEQQNREVDEFRTRFDAEDPDAVVDYFSLVLETSSYPEGFPKQHRMAFVPESKQLVVEFELPSTKVVPLVKQYRYVKARNAIESSARPATQVKALYATVVAETTLRTLHELIAPRRSTRSSSTVTSKRSIPRPASPSLRIWSQCGRPATTFCNWTCTTSSHWLASRG